MRPCSILIPRYVLVIIALATTSASASASAQNVELAGRIVNEAGEPVAAAKVGFESLRMPPPPTPGVRSSYQLAQRLHLAQTKLPRTITDRDGEWRVKLSPVQAALTTSGLSRFLMTVTAKGYAGWQRCVSGDLRDATTQLAVLVAEPSSPPLRIRLANTAGEPVRGVGVAFVERSFRVTGTRAIQVSELVEFGPDGSLAYDKGVRIPGEQPSARPIARAETYRVTIYAAGFEVAQLSLGPGDHLVPLTPSEWGDRAVLGDRATPAALPIRATYTIAKQTIQLEFVEARVPLLGDVEPDAITTGSGPIEVDAWDPDIPMFVMRESNATEASGTVVAKSEQTPDSVKKLPGTVGIIAQGSDCAPIYGAAVWIEDRAVKRATERSDLVAVTNARGEAKLTGLPEGTFSLLVRHPELGFAEALVDVRDAADSGTGLAVQLRPLPTTSHRTTAEPLGDATILLDLRPPTRGAGHPRKPETTSVGIFDGGRGLEWFRMTGSPRWVRLEGLPAGPTNYFVQVGDSKPHFVFGVIALPGAAQPARHRLDTPTTKFTLEVRDAADGTALPGIRVHLGDRRGRGGERASESLFDAIPRADKAFDLDLRLRGVLWAQVELEGYAAREVELVETGGNAARQRIVVELTKLPEPEAATGDSDKGDDEGDKILPRPVLDPQQPVVPERR